MDQPETDPRATILVVDDTPDNLKLLAELLKDTYKVQVANSGLRALEIALRTPPDLILLDVMMPQMDGYQVCSELKSEPTTRDIPILFITALNGEEDETKGFRTGCVDYITKPISPPIVLARVATHLEQSRLRLAERELMEKTLKGSLAMIVEMLAMVDPVAFGWTREMADVCEKVAAALKMEEPWMVGLAAVLSQIGVLTIPDSIMGKVRARSILNTEERDTFSRVPEIGWTLLRNIPRMDEVAEVIHYSQKNYNGSGFPKDNRREEDIPLGARILRVAFDFMTRVAAKETAALVVRDMLHHTAWYDSGVLLRLKDLVDCGDCAPEPAGGDEGTREVALEALVVGQFLAYSVETREGKLLVRAGTALTPSILERLQNFHRIGAIEPTVWIQGA